MFLKDHNKTAIRHSQGAISYRQLIRSAWGYASLLPDHLKRVAIFSENRPEWIFAHYANWARRAVTVPVDFLSTAEEVAHVLADCTPEVVFCSAQRLPVLQAALATIAHQPAILIFEEIGEVEAAPQPFPEPAQDETALIIYTSGTTGAPKGVMLSYRNLLANIEAVSQEVPIYNSEERSLVLLPLHHIFPLMGTVIAPIYTGGTIAICPSMGAEDILTTLQENAITVIIGVPRLWKTIAAGIMSKIKASKLATLLYFAAEKVQSKHLSRILFASVHRRFGGAVRFMISGGAALDLEVGRQLTTLGFEVLEGFGTTETAPMISFTRPGKVHIGSAGGLLTGIDVRFDDDELLVRGNNVMQGYLNRPEETAEALKDGWFHTGDLGYLDDQQRLFITGRKKELLVLSNGKNINPAELENGLEAITPYINEVGVFVDNDILQAVIRPNLARMREDSITDIEDYFRWKVLAPFNQAVSPYKKILQFTLVDEELPRTRLAKIKRFLLPQMVSREQDIRNYAEPPTFEEYLIIKQFIEDLTSRTVHPDDHLEIDIAMDSLDKIGLLEFLNNTFGVEIGEEGLFTHQTVRRLSDFVREKKERISVEMINWRDILREKTEFKLPETRFTTTLFKNMANAFLNVYFRFKSEGRENLPKTPCIIAPNHQSFVDALLVASQLKDHIMKNTYFYAKKKHVKNRFLSYLANRNNVVIMDINTDVKESIQKLATLLSNGKNVMIFPEGTRSSDGRLGDFKKSFAILAKEMNVPVVPVTIKGAFEAMPTGRLIPRPFKKIRVTFQQPVFPEGHTYESLKDQVRQHIEECLESTLSRKPA
ncbi:MAG: long-chain fatty acid--CoA ligase [Desulfobulbus propionicus]|nr:MAG: long-chain fatty acid--CoA ligase [Desulfobulbus propionicus]